MTTLRTERLDLVLLSADFLSALLDGRRRDAARLVPFPVPDWWPQEHEAHFRLRLAQMRRDPASAPWLVRAMVARGAGRAVGRIGFHGPPGTNARHDPRALELGYDVDAGERRLGYASEAAASLIAWARTEHEIRRFLASISPSNAASLGLASKLGFVEIGSHWDEEDGEELVLELNT